MSYNPYADPQRPSQPRYDPEAAKSKLMAPGIALIVVGGIGLLLMGGYAILNIVMIANGALQIEPPPEMKDSDAAGFYFGAYGALAVIMINPIMQILVILGGVAMVRAKGRGLAITGSVLSIIPCFSSSLCLLGIPFGIWAVVVLNDSNVKRLFK